MMLRNSDEAGNIYYIDKGYGFVWISNKVGDNLTSINAFKKRLINNAFQDWRAEISRISKATNYQNYKYLLNDEQYMFENTT